MFFFFNDTATTEIYTYLHTLSLHDALPIYYVLLSYYYSHCCISLISLHILWGGACPWVFPFCSHGRGEGCGQKGNTHGQRSEEHTSELQSLMRNSYAVFCLKKHKYNEY